MHPLSLQFLGNITEALTGETWENPKIISEIVKRTGFYHAKSIGRKTRVLMLHSNNMHFFADLLALWSLGATVTCLDPGIGADEFGALAEEQGAQYGIYRQNIPKKLSTGNLSLKFIDTLEADSYNNKHQRLDFEGGCFDDPALLLYTSGSTGLPKGVVHTHRSLRAKWQVLRQYVPLSDCETSLCFLPTHFGHGLICNALYPLLNGCHLVLLPKADPASLVRLPEILQQYNVTFMSSVPSAWRVILKFAAAPERKTLRRVHIGSAPLSSELWKQVQEWTGTQTVGNTYGITETGSWVAGLPADLREVTPNDGFVGIGWGSDIMISSKDSKSIIINEDLSLPLALPKGEKGYVWLRTQCLMQEYLARPQQTAEVLQQEWFFTGDLGMIDDRGLFYLTGRVRNEINKGGIKISPEEIDLVIETNQDIVEACSFGKEDAVLGQNVAVCVVFRDPENPPTVSSLKIWASNHLSDYKIPALWYAVEAIPKTERGKIKRDDIAKLCQTMVPLR